MTSSRVFGSVFVSLAAAGVVALSACSSDTTVAPTPPASAANRLQGDTGVTWVIEYDEVTGNARLAFPQEPTAVILNAGADPAQVGAEFLARYPEVFGVTSARALQHLSSEKTDEGLQLVRYAQKAGGAVVEDTLLLVVFDANGGVEHVSGPFYTDLDTIAGQTPALNEAQAETRALGHASRLVGANAVRGNEPTVLKVVIDTKSMKPMLVYRVSASTPQGPWLVEVDAMTGNLRMARPRYHAAQASGYGVKGAKRVFTIDDGNTPYLMVRSGENNRPKVTVYSALGANSQTKPDADILSSPDLNDWEQGLPAEVKGMGPDLMERMQLVEDWWRRKLGRPSFDGRRAPIEIYVHTDLYYGGVNAYYSGDQSDPFFLFTRGDGDELPGTTLDTVGHEFMHAVTDHVNGLKYENESGGLNESFSDIFAQLVADGSGGGDPGEYDEEHGTPTRSLRNPKSVSAGEGYPEYPDTYEEVMNNFVGQEFDYGGVHFTSSLSNLAWYLMTFAGKHPTTGYRVRTAEMLGVERSTKLWWALARELSPTSTFRDAAKKSLLVARYQRVPREAVGCAWYAVGVLSYDELKKNYSIVCDDEPSDGGADDDGGSDDASTLDSCAGRADGWYCSAINPAIAFQCSGGSFTGTSPCEGEQRCAIQRTPANAPSCR